MDEHWDKKAWAIVSEINWKFPTPNADVNRIEAALRAAYEQGVEDMRTSNNALRARVETLKGALEAARPYVESFWRTQGSKHDNVLTRIDAALAGKE